MDAVGTLLRPRQPVAETYRIAGERHGYRLSAQTIRARFEEAFRREEQKDRDQDLRTDEAREQARWRAIVTFVFQDQADPLAPFPDLWQHYARPDAWECYPDAVRLLDRLAEVGGQYGIASNFDARLRRIVAGIPQLSRTRHILISSEVGWRKPSARFFDAVTNAFQRPAQDIVYVGDDAQNDFLPAKAYGFRTFLVQRSETLPLPAECVCSLDLLADILDAGKPAIVEPRTRDPDGDECHVAP
jgi:putative hydrolase of the HAD superfamily